MGAGEAPQRTLNMLLKAVADEVSHALTSPLKALAPCRSQASVSMCAKQK